MNRTDHARRQEQGRTREVRSAWIEAVRLRTLPLAASGSVVAAGIAAARWPSSTPWDPIRTGSSPSATP